MTQRPLHLTQNNNFPTRYPSKSLFRFNQFRYKNRKANYDFSKTPLEKQFLRGKLLACVSKNQPAITYQKILMFDNVDLRAQR